jgi:hypothetical protein
VAGLGVCARLAGALFALAPLAFAAAPAEIAPFSNAQPGAALPEGWRIVVLPGRKPADIALVRDGDRTTLRVRADAAIGSAVYRVRSDSRATLAWQWKVDRVVEGGRFGTKEGDDFAARVYVTFDLPMQSLSFVARSRLRFARFLYGDELPAAAICYVWDSRAAVGASAWNPYADRVRMVVVESGAAHAGQWMTEARDVEADFRGAFDWKGEVPRIDGIAVSADTDQTGESVMAWFGDMRLEARR